MNHVSRRTILQGAVGASALGFGGLALASESSANTSDPYYPNAGDWRYSVSHYDVSLTLLTQGNAAARLTGTTTMSAQARTSLSDIQVDMRLGVTSASVNGRTVKVSSGGVGKVVLSGFSVDAGSSFSIVVNYAGYPQNVCVHSEDMAVASDAIAFMGEPLSGPYWHACNDRLDNKATYTTTVCTQATNVALGSGLLQASAHYVSGGTAMTKYVFNLTAPVSSYMPTVQVGRYAVMNDSVTTAGGTVPLRFGAQSNTHLTFMQTHTKQSLQYFSSLYGPYPFNAAGGVAAGGFTIHLWGQETVGSPTYSPAELSSYRGGALVAHENAHMWFGNSVSAASWQDVPLLHEGLAVLLERDYCALHKLYSWYFPDAGHYRSNPGAGNLEWNQAYGVMLELRRRMDNGSSDQAHAPNFTAFLRDLATSYRHANVTRSQFKAVAGRHASNLGSFWSQYGI